jgi:hypothetical protein
VALTVWATAPELAETAPEVVVVVVEVLCLVAIVRLGVDRLGVDPVVELLEEPPQPAISSAAAGPTASQLRARALLERAAAVTVGLAGLVIVRSFAGRLVDLHFPRWGNKRFA